MKRYLVMVTIVALLALPVLVGAEVNDEHFAMPRTSDADLLATKGVITEQELVEVSAPDTTAPAKTDQEKAQYPNRYEPNW